MAAKKSAKVKLPPAWPRVEVAKALASEEARARFFAAMQDLQGSGVVERVMRLVRAERGIWLREGGRWPRWIRQIAEREFELARLVEELAGECHSLSWGGLPAEVRQAFEARALGLVQLLMDAVFVARKDLHSRRSEALAGLSSPTYLLGATLRASSGVEVAGNLAWCIRQAVDGKERAPFLLYAVSSAATKAMRKQVNREPRPGSPGDLYPDDMAILLACMEGPLNAKEVEKKAVLAGESWSASHCNKRKRDLKKWGLLSNSPHFELSAAGREWALLLRSRQNSRQP